MVLTGMRGEASFFNCHLHELDIVCSPTCRRGLKIETQYHYFNVIYTVSQCSINE